MSADIGPGTPLIFVGPDVASDPSGLTIDALYFVHDTMPNIVCEVPLVSLKGSPGNFFYYCSCRFKPIGGGELTEEQIDMYKVPEHA